MEVKFTGNLFVVPAGTGWSYEDKDGKILRCETKSEYHGWNTENGSPCPICGKTESHSIHGDTVKLVDASNP